MIMFILAIALILSAVVVVTGCKATCDAAPVAGPSHESAVTDPQRNSAAAELPRESAAAKSPHESATTELLRESAAASTRVNSMAGYNSRFHPAHISSREAKELADSDGGAAILDVRSEASYLDKHVSDAVNVPYENLADYAANNLPDKDAAVICYCFCDDKGGAALSAYELLTEMGYANAYYFEPGDEWTYEGSSVTKQADVVSIANTFVTAFAAEAPPKKSIISGPEAKEIYESNPDVILLDVRNQDEYDSGHISGSLLIPVGELESRLSELPDKNAEIIVFCRSGRRSANASGILQNNGYANVYDMQAVTNWPDPLVR